jgi:hypothetical protein
VRIHRRSLSWSIASACLIGLVWVVFIVSDSRPRRIATVEQEVAQIRGRPFKHPVSLQYVTHEEALADTLAQAAAREPLPESYGKIVRILGLYRGPEIVDVNRMRRELLIAKSVHGFGFYDSDRRAMFIERGVPEWRLADLYAHEIYHGFQDQYFDLGKYFVHRFTDGSLNADELLARRAVVEGEATYIQLLWKVMHATGRPPARQMIARIVRGAADVDFDALRVTLERQDLSDIDRKRVRSY